MKATSSLAKAWKSDAERTSKYGTHIVKLSHSIQTLITVEAPDSLPVITPTLQILEKWAAVTADLAASKFRIGNDIRDVVERFHVVERVTDQRKSAAKALESAKSKLSEYEDEVATESKRKDYNLKKAEAQLSKLRAAKKEALIKARDFTVLLIRERQKFANFLFRRTQQAYVRLGTTLTRDCSLELAILIKLIEALQKARAGEILEEIDIEVPVIIPRSLADDDGPIDGPIEASLILPEEVIVPEPPKPAEPLQLKRASSVETALFDAGGDPKLVSEEPVAREKHGSVFESALFDGLVAVKATEGERGKSVFADEAVPKKGKLFDVDEIEANLPKKAVAEESNEVGWSGVEIQPVDEGNAIFEVELPQEVPEEGTKRKGKGAAKKGGKKGKRARTTPSPFDDI